MKKKGGTAAGKCRDCGVESRVKRGEFYKLASVRCPACGGVCDPAQPLHSRSTPRRGRVALRKSPNRPSKAARR